MAFLSSILRARRGDLNLFLIAALVAMLVVPGASHAVLPPQSCEAVLFWLQSESSAVATSPVAKASMLVAIAHQRAEEPSQVVSDHLLLTATSHCGQLSELLAPPSLSEPQLVPVTTELDRHVVAHLSGVRTNRRLI